MRDKFCPKTSGLIRSGLQGAPLLSQSFRSPHIPGQRRSIMVYPDQGIPGMRETCDLGTPGTRAGAGTGIGPGGVPQHTNFCESCKILIVYGSPSTANRQHCATRTQALQAINRTGKGKINTEQYKHTMTLCTGLLDRASGPRVGLPRPVLGRFGRKPRVNGPSTCPKLREPSPDAFGPVCGPFGIVLRP